MYYPYPATKTTGFSKVVPAYAKGVVPWGYGKTYGYGKPYGFAKPYGYGKPYAFGKPYGFAKPYGYAKPIGFGKPYGYPATKAGGYSAKVPATTVATSPYPWAI